MIKKFVIISYAVLIAAIIVLVMILSKVSDENERHKTNEKALMTEMKSYITQSEKNAASIIALELSNREIKKQKKEVEEKCNEMSIKLKRMQTYSNTTTISGYDLKIPIHDSVFFCSIDTLKCVDFDNSYYSIHACNSNDTLEGTFVTRDTITTIIHRIPRKFLFIKFGTKEIRCDVMSSNPHTQIVKHETIIKKK